MEQISTNVYGFNISFYRSYFTLKGYSSVKYKKIMRLFLKGPLEIVGP